MRISAVLLAIIGTLSMASAQSTNDKNNLFNCILCVDKGKKWDNFGTKCVDSEALTFSATMQACVLYHTALVSYEITTVED